MKHMLYCLEFKLFAKHYVQIEGSPGQCHSHSWNIAVYINANNHFKQFYKVENLINNLLGKYSNTVLNNHSEFAFVEPSLENIGEVLLKKISETLISYDMKVEKLEISETPARICVVRSREYDALLAKDSAFAGKFLNKIIASTISMMSNNYSNKPAPSEQEREEAPPLQEQRQNAPIQKKHASVELHKYNNLNIKAICAVLFILVSGVLLLLYVNRRGREPWGSDAFGHIFKADLLYKSIKKGDFFPLYTDLWYNGIQPFRYWAPLPYYILALLQFIVKGNPVSAYNAFIYLSFCGGAFGWLIWGIKERKVLVSVVVGVVWFCLPDNIRVFFSEGNIPRSAIAIMLPYMFFFIWQYCEHKKDYALLGIVLITATIAMCHLMIAAMIGITAFLFMLFYSIINKKIRRPSDVIIGILLGISICGAYLYPALQGGLMALDSEAVSEVMKALTFPFTQSLNPSLRHINIEIYYFGLSVFIIALLGVFLADKKSIPSFVTVLIIFLGTTTALVPILIKLPLNQLLWMMRFTPIAYALFSSGIILWKSARRYFMAFLLVLIIVDSGLSFKMLAFNSTPFPDTVNMLRQTVDVTGQRVALMDLSEFGSFPSFYFCSGQNNTKYAYGWAWQGAATASNIVLLNTALENEYYGFMFDRLVELGCDSVLVKRDKVKDLDRLYDNARKCGYYLAKEFNMGLLFKVETPNSFGVKSRYYGLAIGNSASNITLEFPGYQIGNSYCLDDYTLDQLLQYEMVYVSGFTYRQKEIAEKLLYEVAEGGVKVIIDMNKVPNDPLTNRLTFMGVTAQPIQFEHKLPNLHVKDYVYFPTIFQEEYRNWNTVYLEDVPNPTGFSWMGGNKLTFIGTGENSNIVYVGFNLLFHGIINKDRMAIDIYAGVMGKNAETLPEREIIPINVEYLNNKIIIDSPADDVNTTIADLDAFKTERRTYALHNLLVVGSGRTEIEITYPYLEKGIVISIAGLILTICFLGFRFKKRGDGH